MENGFIFASLNRKDMTLKSETKQLQVGDVVYQIYRGAVKSRERIARVTAKRAYSHSDRSEYEREYGLRVRKRGVDEYGMYEYKISTKELDAEFEKAALVSKIQEFPFRRLSIEQLQRIEKIIEEC